MSNQDLTPAVSALDHVVGAPQAVLTLVQYGDYECPFTSGFHWQMELLLKNFPAEFRFVFRHFPLVKKHLFAMRAAEAAEAASAQERFWQMHRLLLTRQYTLGWEGLRDAARSLNLDLEKFEVDVNGHRHRKKIQADVDGALRSGVASTPAYFVNGAFYEGDDHYDIFAKMIEETRRG